MQKITILKMGTPKSKVKNFVLRFNPDSESLRFNLCKSPGKRVNCEVGKSAETNSNSVGLIPMLLLFCLDSSERIPSIVEKAASNR